MVRFAGHSAGKGHLSERTQLAGEVVLPYFRVGSGATNRVSFDKPASFDWLPPGVTVSDHDPGLTAPFTAPCAQHPRPKAVARSAWKAPASPPKHEATSGR